MKSVKILLFSILVISSLPTQTMDDPQRKQLELQALRKLCDDECIWREPKKYKHSSNCCTLWLMGFPLAVTAAGFIMQILLSKECESRFCLQ